MMLEGNAAPPSSQVSRCTSLASAGGCSPTLPVLPRSVFALPRPDHDVRDACNMLIHLIRRCHIIWDLDPPASSKYLQTWVLALLECDARSCQELPAAGLLGA